MENGVYRIKGTIVDVSGKTHDLDGDYNVRVHTQGLRADISKNIVAEIEADAENGADLVDEISRSPSINKVGPYEPDFTVKASDLADLNPIFRRPPIA